MKEIEKLSTAAARLNNVNRNATAPVRKTKAFDYIDLIDWVWNTQQQSGPA